MSGHLSDRKLGEENSGTRELIPNSKTHKTAQQLWGPAVRIQICRKPHFGGGKGRCMDSER